jgi:polar amino acid transport system substrate-binding protein
MRRQKSFSNSQMNATKHLAAGAFRFFIAFLLIALFASAISAPARAAEPSAGPQKKLVVAVVNDPPFSVKNETGQWTGFNVDLWRYLAVDLKLDYELKEMSFKEIQDALHAGTIDLSIAALFETAERYRRFDFSTTVGTTRLAVAVLPEKDTHPWLAAIRILLSWGIVKTVILFFAALFALGFILWRIERNDNPDHFGGHPVKGVGTGTYWVSSTLAAGACYDITLKSLPARIIGLAWMLVGALAFSAFTASLASSLVSHRQMIELYDMGKLHNMRLGVLRDTLQHSLARQAGAKCVLYDKEDDALKALKNKRIYGLFLDEVVLDYYAARDPEHPLNVHPVNLKPKRFAFAFPKKSPLRQPTNLAITEIMEKPEWEALAGRYGLDTNLEPKPVPLGKRSRFSR